MALYDVATTFRDGHTTYHAGERVIVANFTPERLEDFITYGWLVTPNAEPTRVDQRPKSATLDIQTARIGHFAEEF